MELSLPLPRSPRGRLLRHCPADGCVPRRFQLGGVPTDQTIDEANAALVRRHPGTPGTTCPYCGTDSDDQNFHAPEDIENAKKQVVWAAKEDIGRWTEEIARGFNRSMPSGGLISMSMKVKRSANPRPYAWREDLLRGLTCDVCGRDYGVYAIALFCPDCGARNVHVHFAREVALVEQQVGLSDRAAEDGDEELAFRLLGNAHEDVLTALETYLRTTFLFLARTRLGGDGLENAAKLARRGNPFQSIDRTRELFGEISIDPFANLSDEELEFLARVIHKRHIIGHNLGLADEKYLLSTGDGAEGQNVRLVGDEVRRFAKIAYEVVVAGIEETAQEFVPMGAPGPPAVT